MTPPLTEDMKRRGFKWRQTIQGNYLMVCSTCGSNCGQCGDTDRLGNFTDVQWADGKSQLQSLVEATQPGPAPILLSKRVDRTLLFWAFITIAGIFLIYKGTHS